MSAPVKGLVKEPVVFCQTLRLASEGPVAVGDLPQGRNLSFGRMPRREGRGGTFKDFTNCVQLGDHASIELGDDHTAVWISYSQPVTFQAAQRLTHGCSATAKQFSKFYLKEPVAGFQIARLNGVPQSAVGLFAAGERALIRTARPSGRPIGRRYFS